MCPLSSFTGLPAIADPSNATPGLFNARYSILSQNLDQLNSDISVSIGRYVVGGSDFPTIQSALDAIVTDGGGEVFIPQGTYQISSFLSANLANNGGFVLRGSGMSTIIKPTSAMTCLVIDLGTSNFQGVVIEDLMFDLNDTDSGAIELRGAGQHSAIRDVWIDNNAAGAVTPIIYLDSNSHSMRLQDIRIRSGSTTADAVVVNPNIVTIDGLDVTAARAAIKIPNAANTTGLNILNCRLDECDNALNVDGAAIRSLNVIHNRFESNRESHLSLAGFGATRPNKMEGITIRDNYFTGLNSSNSTGIALLRANNVVIERNHFRGTSASATALWFVSGAQDVWLTGNSTETVSVSMVGLTGVPLAVDDLTITQSSSSFHGYLAGAAPAAGTSSGETGQIGWDSSYVYMCTSTDSWSRATLETF